VKPYCTRTSTPVMAVNLGSNEDVSHGGTNFKKQSAYSNLKVEVKGPSDSAYPTGTINALSVIQAENCDENHGLEIEDCPDEGGTKNLAYIACVGNFSLWHCCRYCADFNKEPVKKTD